jgi:hypothetical protein
MDAMWGLHFRCECYTKSLNVFSMVKSWGNYYALSYVVTLALGLQRCGPQASPEVTFHAPRSARECEEMNPHTPK